jgi:2-iminobutanoate/2-iminopropanoate deaminase
MLSVAGQAGIDPASNSVVDGGLEAEIRQTFVNIETALAASGATLDDVLRVDVFLTDPAEFEAMNAVYNGTFHEPYPSRTTIFVGLVAPLKVEITVLAVLPETADA